MRQPPFDAPRSPAQLDDGTEDPFSPSIGTLPDVSGADEAAVTKTGTTTIGITTEDGVIIATDQRASLGGRFVSNKNVQKVEEVHPRAALTLVGSVGGAQSFISNLRAEVNLYEARRGEPMSMQALSTLAGNFLRGGPFFRIAPILGGVDEDGSHVYSLDPTGSVLSDDYTVSGSGMQLAHGTLEQFYEDDLSNDEAIEVAARGIQSAAERDTASGNGIFVAEITEDGVDIHGHEEYEDLL